MSIQSRYQESILRPEWADKTNAIKQRDLFECQNCGSKTNLHVHHKYYVSNRLPWEYPDTALITLCNICHSKEHLKTIPLYSEGQMNLLQIEASDLYNDRLKERLEQQQRWKRETDEKKQKRIDKRRAKPQIEVESLDGKKTIFSCQKRATKEAPFFAVEKKFFCRELEMESWNRLIKKMANWFCKSR